MAPTDTVVLAVFYTFNMIGQIVLTLSLATIAVARLGREMLLINIGVAMVIFSTACLLLLYADAYDGPEPPFGLCLAQACLIYGSLPMAASSAFGLFFQDGFRDRRDVKRSRDFFYCSASPRMGYTCEILCAIFMLASVLVEVQVVYMLVDRWRKRTLRRELLPIDSLVRLGLFTFYGILTVDGCRADSLLERNLP
ncbi:hypothetical protein AURDEDRAFT_166473 [Auricularia subglabra TFB-10046 SS5]|nr:hypothetical protein AURDEDRAFT_166473 [Auricularia subglabra TFB-10046 SS5]